MTTPTDPITTPEELTIALLNIQTRIAACRKQEGETPWIITANLRHLAQDIAAAYVDPTYVKEENE